MRGKQAPKNDSLLPFPKYFRRKKKRDRGEKILRENRSPVSTFFSHGLSVVSLQKCLRNILLFFPFLLRNYKGKQEEAAEVFRLRSVPAVFRLRTATNDTPFPSPEIFWLLAEKKAINIQGKRNCIGILFCALGGLCRSQLPKYFFSSMIQISFFSRNSFSFLLLFPPPAKEEGEEEEEAIIICFPQPAIKEEFRKKGKKTVSLSGTQGACLGKHLIYHHKIMPYPGSTKPSRRNTCEKTLFAETNVWFSFWQRFLF